MSGDKDKKIETILSKYGEPLAGNIWRVQGTAVIFHSTLERIAAHAKIRFDAPVIVRAERDEAVILVTGRLDDYSEWSVGEALIGVNYRVSGKQAAYVWAMAEKRAKDRVILKLIGLSGLLYSEEEADDFKRSKADASAPVGADDGDGANAEAYRFIAECNTRIDSATNAADLIGWWRSDDRKKACKDFDLRPDEITKVRDRLMARINDLNSKREAAE